MTFNEYNGYDALGLAELIRQRQVTPQELLDTAIDRVATHDATINAVVTQMYEQARTAIAVGLPDGPFAGVPFMLKDLGALYAGVRTSNGSRIFADFVPDHDSTLVERYKAAGLVIMAPWLIFLLILALVPAFLGEAHFNSLSYSLMFAFTPERRELDYLRFVGASDETAKEVKIFGLSGFLSERYRQLADKLYRENRRLSTRRAAWGSLLAAVGSPACRPAVEILKL